MWLGAPTPSRTATARKHYEAKRTRTSIIKSELLELPLLLPLSLPGAESLRLAASSTFPAADAGAASPIVASSSPPSFLPLPFALSAAASEEFAAPGRAAAGFSSEEDMSDSSLLPPLALLAPPPPLLLLLLLLLLLALPADAPAAAVLALVVFVVEAEAEAETVGSTATGVPSRWTGSEAWRRTQSRMRFS